MATPADESINVNMEDNIHNRLLQFVANAVTEFNDKVLNVISVSKNAQNAHTSSISGGISTVVGGASAGLLGLATGGVGAGAGKAAGGAVGGAVGKAIKKYEQNEEHKKAKHLEKYFEGFEDPEQFESWKRWLIETFVDIFINYNIQFWHLLQNPVDSWTKIMKKMAKDSVHRIFDHLGNENSSNQFTEFKVTKARLIDCFLKGRSEKKPFKTDYVGGEIRIQNGEKKVFTSELFEKPVRAEKYDDGNSNKRDKTTSFYYRYSFGHEQGFQKEKLSPIKPEIDCRKKLVIRRNDRIKELQERFSHHHLIRGIADATTESMATLLC